MKIYTKTGDDGTTSLFGGGQVTKHPLRVDAYGISILIPIVVIVFGIGMLIGRISRIAKELEHVAQDVEKRAEKRIGQVSNVASNNVWITILLAFSVGVAVGVLFKIFNHQNMRDFE